MYPGKVSQKRSETSRGRSDVHGDLVNVAQPTEAASMKALSRD